MTIYIYLLEISNYKEEYQNFVEQNSEVIFDEKQSRHWYTVKLQYYYNLNKKDEYLKLYNPKLDNKVKNPLFKIMYLVLNEKYKAAPINIKTNMFFPHNRLLTLSTIL